MNAGKLFISMRLVNLRYDLEFMLNEIFMRKLKSSFH